MVDIDFVAQLIDSMESSVLKLEQAVNSKNNDEANKLRAFIFNLHKQIENAIRGK